MNPVLLKTYHRLPPAGRSIAVFFHGRRLQSWRYGPETERLVAEALERESWPKSRWQSWIDERLARMLHRAATRVPYYREHWTARRRRGDGSSWEHLENWPVLEKTVLRKYSDAFLVDGCDRRSLRTENSSGTTGTPVKIWWSRNTARAWYALLEARVRRWHGVTGQDRWAMLGGQVVVPIHQKRPPFWVWNESMRQLYLSSFHLDANSSGLYFDAIRRYGITYMLGYSSSLNVLAREARKRSETLGQCRLVITNAEPLHETQRSLISETFRCPVRETYGMAEIVSGASECERGSMHLWPEVGVTEVLRREGRAWQDCDGREGDFICTGLLNQDMPLVRYAVGDSGSAPQWDAECTCGRSLPQLPKIQGRSSDMLISSDGRKVFWLNPVFYGLPIEEAQLVQERIGEVIFRYAPAAGFAERSLKEISARLRERLGPVEIHAEAVSQISREANGKFRAVVCKVPLNERPE